MLLSLSLVHIKYSHVYCVRFEPFTGKHNDFTRLKEKRKNAANCSTPQTYINQVDNFTQFNLHSLNASRKRAKKNLNQSIIYLIFNLCKHQVFIAFFLSLDILHKLPIISTSRQASKQSIFFLQKYNQNMIIFSTDLSYRQRCNKFLHSLVYVA